MALNSKIEAGLRKAIKHFWLTRSKQAKNQGKKTGSRDAGARTAVTGGRQMDGFVSLVRDFLNKNGLPKAHVFCEKRIDSPAGIARKKSGIS